MPYSISGTTITVSGTVDLRSVSLPTLYGVNFAAGGASATFHGMTFAAPQPPGNSYVVVGSTSSDVLTLTLTSLPFGAGWTRIDMTFFSFASWSADDLIVLNGDGNDDVIWASSQKETINGGGGNDSLSSRTRDSRFADTLHGGEGNDTYYVHPSDLVDESDSGGIDTIESDLSYDLRTARILGQVENLILTATDFDSSATGNALDNKLVGGLANNTLNGLGGDDFMQGRRGSDTYVVDTASDIVDESDNMPGGIDTVRSSVSFSLLDAVHSRGAVENLVLTGAALIAEGNGLANQLTGNGLGNTLSGGGGNDVLNGAAGADRLDGGGGNDTYVLGSEATGLDKIIDSSGVADTITSQVNRNLSFGDYSEIENLVLLGNAVSGLGNGAPNVITGSVKANALFGYLGNDKFIGGAGGDRLAGGPGADQFIFNSVAESRVGFGCDFIVDFSRAQGDRIVLSTIDANTAAAGNQTFAFIGAAAFTKKAGELRYRKVGADTHIQGDVNGDGIGDLTIISDLPLSFASTDFVL